MAADLQRLYEEELKKRLGEQGAAEWLKERPSFGGYAGSQTGGMYVGNGGAPVTGTVGPAASERLSGALSQPRQVKMPKPTTPQTFTLQQLQQAMQQPLPAPMDARFATPEQMAEWIAVFQQALQPWLQASKEAATADFNRALYQLQNQWAAQGMLASGGAASQARQAAKEFGLGLREQDTRAMAEAVNQALQAGQLSLGEAAEIWNQAFQGRQTDITNLLAALGQQEQMRQFEQGFGLDVERLRSQEYANWMNALLSMAGLQEEARQFNQLYPLRVGELTGYYGDQPTLARWQAQLQAALDQQRIGLGYAQLEQDKWYREQSLDLQREELKYQIKNTIDPVKRMYMENLDGIYAAIDEKKDDYNKAGSRRKQEIIEEAKNDLAVAYSLGRIGYEEYQRGLNAIAIAFPSPATKGGSGIFSTWQPPYATTNLMEQMTGGGRWRLP